MKGQQFKARDKITQKMTRHGLVEQNQSTGQEQRISQRLQDVSFHQTSTTGEPMTGGRSRQTIPPASNPAHRQTAQYFQQTGQQGFPEDVQNTAHSVNSSMAQDVPFQSAAPAVSAADWYQDHPTKGPADAAISRLKVSRTGPSSVEYAGQRARSAQDIPIHSHPNKTTRYAAYNPTDWKETAAPPDAALNPTSIAAPDIICPTGPDQDVAAIPSQEAAHRPPQEPGRFQLYEDSPIAASFQEPPPRLRFDAPQTSYQTERPSRTPEPARNTPAANQKRRLSLKAARWIVPDVSGRVSDTQQKRFAYKRASAAYREKDAPEKAGREFIRDAAPAPENPHSSRLHFEKEDDPSDQPGKSKIERLEEKNERLINKLDSAKAKLPTRRRLHIAREYDAQTGRVHNRLQFEKEAVQRPREPLAITRLAEKAAYAGIQFVHKKISEVEKENVGVEAGHKTEQTAENLARARKAYIRHSDKVKFRRVARLENKTAKVSVKLEYNRFLQEHPELKKKHLSKLLQKRRIKRAYAKAKREAIRQGAKGTAAAARGAASLSGKIGGWVVSLVKSHPAVAVGIIGIVLLIAMIAGMVSSCGAMLTGGFAAVFIPSYKAEDVDIEGSSLQWTEMEQDLKEQIKNVEQDYPDFDEYRYEIGEIAHDPFEIISFLAAMYEDFIYTDVAGVLTEIFNQVYELQLVEEIEIRTRENEDGEEEEYEWKILNVILEPKDFEEVVGPIMEAAQKDDLYGAYNDNFGGHQKYGNPLKYEWFNSITSKYGYRENPTGEGNQIHRGLDIAAPTGTPLYAIQDGKVIDAGNRGDWGNTVIVEDTNGRQTRFAHCSELFVSVGQKVKKGDKIAAVGRTGNSTGSHVHVEIRENGQYLNPLFMMEYTKPREEADEN